MGDIAGRMEDVNSDLISQIKKEHVNAVRSMVKKGKGKRKYRVFSKVRLMWMALRRVSLLA